jgi:hypothetical protein
MAELRLAHAIQQQEQIPHHCGLAVGSTSEFGMAVLRVRATDRANLN